MAASDEVELRMWFD